MSVETFKTSINSFVVYLFNNTRVHYNCLIRNYYSQYQGKNVCTLEKVNNICHNNVLYI